MALPRSHRSAFQSVKNKENRDLVSQNPQNFLACGAASRSLRLTVTRRCFHCGTSGCYTFSDNDTACTRTECRVTDATREKPMLATCARRGKRGSRASRACTLWLSPLGVGGGRGGRQGMSSLRRACGLRMTCDYGVMSDLGRFWCVCVYLAILCGGEGGASYVSL